ncbi:MAG: ketopantoate reductase family protein [Chloroflexota bacterium]
MRVLVMGAGALGGCYGAALAQHGHAVTFVARGEHLSAMQAHGLEIRHGEDRTLLKPVRAVATPSEAGSAFDLVLFAVKGYDIDTAAAALLPVLEPDTAVLPLQNGVDSVDRLATLLGPEHVLAGVSYIRAGRPAPGVLEFVSHLRPTVIGEQSGHLTPRVEAIAAALGEAGIPVVISDDPRRAIWEKFVGMVALGTITSACAAPIGPIRETAEGQALLRNLLDEAVTVGQAAGVTLTAATVDQMLNIVAAMPPTNSTSLRDDFERRHRTELDFLTGAMVRYGRNLGVATPAFAALYAVLKVRALSFGGL